MSNMFDGNEVPDASNSKDRVLINVGGIRHECYISTIQNFPDTRLYWIAETAMKMADFDPDGNEFFFDRHPHCFANILNYCRTGKLHCPNDVCGPLFEQELAFWGVDELMMEPCCWGGYTQHRNAHKNLSMFDEMRINQVGDEDGDGDESDPEDADFMMKSLQNHGGCCSKYKTWNRWLYYRPKVWSILEKPFSSVYAQISAFISMLVIIISLGTFCAETIERFKAQRQLFYHLEYFYCTFFTLELLLRLSCCPSFKKYFKSPMTWIDIISTLQFYISFIAETDSFDFLFVSRLLRIFRLFRFFKNLSGMQVIAQTLKASANELLLLCIIVLIPMVIFSTLVFYAEEPSTKFSSIPGTFWWTVITMTTVGYGDVTPTSLMGKVIGAFCACSGVLIVALPVSVIGSNFNLYYSYAQARMKLPKRKNPALVFADKALVTSNIEKGTTEEHGSDGESLKCLATVMIDMSKAAENSPTPSRTSSTTPAFRRERSTRRHAIHVEPTNPTTPQKLDRTNSKKQNTRNVDKITIEEEKILTCKYNNITTQDSSEDDKNADDKSSTSKLNASELNGRNRDIFNVEEYEMKNATLNEQLHSVNPPSYEECKSITDSSEDQKTKIITRGRSTSAPYNRRLTICSDNSIPTSPDNMYRKRTVIHVDLTKYVPKRIGKNEQKARHRRLTQNTAPVFDSGELSVSLLEQCSEDNLSNQAPWMKAAENALHQEEQEADDDVTEMLLVTDR